MYLAVYKGFMESVDAIDNGVNQYVSDSPPLYVNNTTLSARVGSLNPRCACIALGIPATAGGGSSAHPAPSCIVCQVERGRVGRGARQAVPRGHRADGAGVHRGAGLLRQVSGRGAKPGARAC